MMRVRVFGVSVLASCVVLLVSSCVSDDPPKEEEKGSRVALVNPSPRDCGWIFDKKTMSEFSGNKKMQRVYHPGRNTSNGSFGMAARIRLNVKMSTFAQDLGGCYFGDKNKKNLINVVENWGPEVFPRPAIERGWDVDFMQEPDDSEGERFRLLVDCRRPDLVRKAKLEEGLALRVTLTDAVGLSERTRASLLMNGAKILVDVVDCHNKVEFPEPESVEFGSGS